MLRLNIYIVEDNELMAAVLKQLLISLGHNVCGCAATYQHAVNELPKVNPDLVITDIILIGKETGIDLGRYIKAHLNIPFIYLSSITASDVIKEALNSLPDTYLFKPVTKPALAEAISNFKERNEIFINKKLANFCPPE